MALIDPIAVTEIQTVRRAGNGRPFHGEPRITHFIDHSQKDLREDRSW
ncbi:hypothetical protein ACQP1K_05605 [Sphaerimonospora sp. CA-214678]